jgi:hypothetical protein
VVYLSFYFIFSEIVAEIIKPLRFVITKPPNRDITIKQRIPQGAATDGFGQTVAIKLNNDTDI